LYITSTLLNVNTYLFLSATGGDVHDKSDKT
jgi:hypothetical protein